MTEEIVARHSRLIGGSTAARLIACPGSHALLQKIPDVVETPSIWAEAGTAQHEAMTELLDNEADPATMLGRVFNGITLTEEHVANLRAACDFANCKIESGDEFILEEAVAFPGVPDAFGTLDLAIRKATESRVVLIDWKFGSGQPVPASTDSVPNAQLMFYAAALRDTYPSFFGGAEEIELNIFQPAFASDGGSVTVTPDDLDAFVNTVKIAVQTARSLNPPRQHGPWCRFAACKSICPLWTGPLLDLTQLALPVRDEPDYGERLAFGLALAAAVEPMISDFKNHAHAFLEAGGSVPGYKLVPKRAMRRWANEDAALAALVKSGFDPAAVVDLKSVAQVEKIAKATGLPLPKTAEIASISSGTTLARDDDPRPEITGQGAAIEFFRRSIAMLEKSHELQ